jgi:hypothetical protein
MKYRAFFLATEFHQRWLDDFVASGPIPVTSVFDHGFYAQGSYIFKPLNVEVPHARSGVGAPASASKYDDVDLRTPVPRQPLASG